MGRVVPALLLAVTVAVLSAMPGADAERRSVAAAEVTAPDPSQQLNSSAPVARRDAARKAAVEIGDRVDRTDSLAHHPTATLVPAVAMASRSVLSGRVDDVARSRIAVIATRHSGRGPPTGAALTSS